MDKKVLMIAAHPDDEIMGAGATMAMHVSQNDEVRCIILGEGQTSRYNNRCEVSSEVLDRLHNDTIEASKFIGFSKVYFANFPDNRFDRVDLLDIIKYVENIIKEYKPDIVYTHYSGDLNIDHQLTFKAALTATRPFGTYTVKELYTFSTLSSTEWNFGYGNTFRPNYFIDIEEYMDKKINAMKCYKSELCQFPHPRSIEGIRLQAKNFGIVIGKNYAEAFMIIRKIASFDEEK